VFIEKLKSNVVMGAQHGLQIEDLRAWQFANANQVPQIKEKHIPRMILHYAIPSLPLSSGLLGDISDDPKLSVLDLANEVTFLTLYAAPSTLVDRVRLRKRSNRQVLLRSPRKFLLESRRLRRLEELYKRQDQMSLVYDKWFVYCQRYEASAHWLVCVESDPVWTPISDWQEIANNLFA
jgi:hypothetical protein